MGQPEILTQVDHLLESALVKLGKAQDASAVEKVRVILTKR